MRLFKRPDGLRASQRDNGVPAAAMPLLPGRCLLRDTRGAGAIEFGFIAPIFALVTIGIADLSLGLARKYELEQASYRALEMVSVSGTEGGYAFVRPEAAAAAGVPLANVTVTTRLECGGVERPFTEGCGAAQEIARFVTVAIRDNYRPTFAYSPLGRSADGTIPLTARSTVRVQ